MVGLRTLLFWKTTFNHKFLVNYIKEENKKLQSLIANLFDICSLSSIFSKTVIRYNRVKALFYKIKRQMQ